VSETKVIEGTVEAQAMVNPPADAGAALPAARPVNLVAGAGIKPIIPQTFDEAFRLARWIAAARWAPKSYLIDPKNAAAGYDEKKISIGILQGLEVGLAPMAALQSIAVINGTPSIWGDGALAIIQASWLLEDHAEKVEADGKGGFIATVTMLRRGRPTPVTQRFSTDDAKRAGLTTKDTWQNYPQRMVVMRARAWVMRNLFADVLRGLAIREEMEDIVIDVTPPPPKGGKPADARAALDAFAAAEPANVAPQGAKDSGAGGSPAKTAGAPPAAAVQATGAEPPPADPPADHGEIPAPPPEDLPEMPSTVLEAWNADGKWMPAWKWLSQTLPKLAPEAAQVLAESHADILHAVAKHNEAYGKAVGDLLAKAGVTL
jgi:hypothetical protein